MTVTESEIKLTSTELTGFLKAVQAKGGLFKFTAKGMSMSPFICNNDIIIIEPFNLKPPEVGDIVAATLPGTERLIVHRIVQILEDHYKLKGDNLFDSDGYFTRTDIQGRVSRVIVNKENPSSLVKVLRSLILFLGRFKGTVALMSRNKILTLFCKIANKVISRINNIGNR